MQRNSLAVITCASFLLAGCNQAQTPVYVDLDSILKQEKLVPPVATPIPKPPPTRPFLVETVPGAPAVAIQDPANAPKQNVQEMFQAEQAKAFSELQRRLRQFYQGEIQSFTLQEERSISGEEQEAYSKANAKIRPLFEAWARDRAPKFAKLALLAGFPDPNPNSNPPDKSLPIAIRNRADEAKQLRLDLKKMDAEFQEQSRLILAVLLSKSASDQATLKLKIEEFASQLDKRAEDEARAQIRMATSHLTFELANPAPIQLPATSAHHVTIPAENPLEPAPEVPSSGILVGTADRRRLLEHELRIWLALNRYTLSDKPTGYRNVTQEFQLWRVQHGAGP